MLIWIIDEEWSDYDMEKEILSKEFPEVEIKISNYNYEKDLKEFGYKADGILIQIYGYLKEDAIEQLVQCKGIATYGGGYDRIDIEACKKKKIHVTNIQDYCTMDIAYYTMAAIYHCNNRLFDYNNRILEDINRGKWGAQSVIQPIHRLDQQTLLIIGFGMIGKKVAEIAQQNNLNIIAYDEFLSKEEIEKYGVKKVEWEEGFHQADYVSVNLKGCDENKDKITYRELKMMKKTAYIINTARGKIIREKDLIHAVNEKEISGAILDVIQVEPPTGKEEILHCDNIIVTPHISYISIESFHLLKKYAIENLISMLKGEKPRDFVC
ncbi:MAG: NAD(P)-dependent oxidoreductase [Tissierellia bacterium]|nr:NAD(P)-dependent oxidoreductase [Tissierellia bacterium]